ncbi:response regulators [Candidatus Scalindua japonica]|uniref:Response regulators n=1 Tax=Candidatus Scalindua japonica TaxID=1284222 RepID=A0A286TVC4_9BACT|nr:response regulator [Candidatus Scalindua japonica]GAX59842.1 response regulators [Candidatus Scalindua japonica]
MRNKKILIIDDDPDIVEAMRMPLEANGYNVISASSGKDGLQRAKEEVPDLIILDVMMENDTAGFHVAYELKSEEPDSEYKDCRNIPILMITAISQKKGMSFSPDNDDTFLPVDGFIEKPVQPKDLLERAAEYLAVKE